MLRRPRPVFLSALALSVASLIAGCSTEAAPVPTTTTAPRFLMSGLPAPVGDGSALVGQVATAASIDPANQIGSKVAGNRVLTIGDSVMASTASRYTNDMCKALVPLGWQVEVEAETGRFVDFGTKVLNRRWSAGWDVVVILLGNNYMEFQAGYRNELESIISRIEPNPVVLLTVTEFKKSRRRVNEVIREMATTHKNVTVVDWATITADDPTLTGGDHLHLTLPGRKKLAETVAQALGSSPAGPGDCMPSVFKDDSAIPVTGTTVAGGSTTSTVTTSRPTTTAPATTTAG
jgi:hypothetical protein